MNNNQPPINIEKAVLGKIKTRKLLMRAHWKFVLEKIGFESGTLLLIVLASGLLSLSYLYSRSNEINYLFDFGPEGWLLVLKNFPFELVVVALALMFIVNKLSRKLEISYKMRTTYWYLVLLGLVFLIIMLIELLGLHKALDDYETSVDQSIIAPYFVNRLHHVRNMTLEAEVLTVGEDDFKTNFLINNKATTSTFKNKKIKRSNSAHQLSPGDKIKIFGEWRDTQFVPWGVYKR
jgi:hypothetical protein